MPPARHDGRQGAQRPHLTFFSVPPFALLSPLQDTESIAPQHQQPPRATRQKTTHAAPPRQQEHVRAAPKSQPLQPRAASSSKQTSPPQVAPSSSLESPTTPSVPPTSLPPTPTRDELLLGFFHHNATDEGLSYTLCVLPAGDDRTRGEWELYEDFDPTKRSNTSTARPAPSTTTRRRTTWSGRWSLRPERDGFGWVELLKTTEAVQENGRTAELQCLMSQCCPYNLTTENAADGSRRKVMGIMLNAFDRSGGLFLTRAL